jgi:hypothetical protein
MESTKDILQLPYLQLPLSKDFKKFMNISGFGNLEEMLELPAYKLLEMKGFNTHKLFELFRYLEANGLDKKLKTS